MAAKKIASKPFAAANGGKPPKPAAELAARSAKGWPRFSIQVPEALLARIDALADSHYRPRNAEIIEALVAWADASEARAAKPTKR